MAGSRKSRPSDFVADVAARLVPYLQPGDGITAALSGGLDSVVLLDCLARLRDAHRFLLEAIHVNHGLSPNAASWAGFCADFCRVRGVPLRIVEVSVERKRGDSLEAAARRARYAVFRRHVSGVLALAHHLDDQAETVFLQILRGAGPRGVAAMPFRREEVERGHEQDPLIFLRPLLPAPRSAIEAYAREARLTWVEDESNADLQHDRNYLRARVLPAIEARFPGYRQGLGRSAALCAEASILLDELAALDAGQGLRDGTLDMQILRHVSEPRARNVLRWFLRLQGAQAPSANRLKEALRQLVSAREDARLRVAVGDMELRRHRGRVQVVKVTRGAAAAVVWRGEAVLSGPGDTGELHFVPIEGAGIALARLSGRHVELRLRRGGERIRPHCDRPRRTLKNLLQEARIEPWQRGRMPLLFCDGQLVWVPGIGIDCAWQAASGDPGVIPEWPVRSRTGCTPIEA